MTASLEAFISSQLDRLARLGCRYAFHYRSGDAVIDVGTAEEFPSASLIKVPILLAWLALERRGELDREELCDLDSGPQVQGAGFSWLLGARTLPYRDCLLLMIAVSDNACTNRVIERAGMERLNRVMAEELGLGGTRLRRMMMDFEARARGEENTITVADARRLYRLVADLPDPEREWVDALLAANQDDALLMRCHPRDSLAFHHKTGSLPGVLHDWGYTRGKEMFLLTREVRDKDQPAVFEVFGELGRLLAG
ncbi:MAG TPA: serine hydrolase [Chloroflexi bacterium]|nr:serine hydrolase [Chloroflexota bacterium]HPO58351.1 class A beta-lactamase-related serine hydrolase [Anaerolineaceae bacterium]